MSYYQVLGLPVDANDDDIRAAYKQRSQETLMDTEAYDQVQSAYETLASPDKKAIYDAELNETTLQPQVPPKKGGTIPLRRNKTTSLETVIPTDSTRAFLSVVCPICTQQNSVGDRYCTECGFLLASAPEEELLQPTISVRPSTPRLESASGISHAIRPGLNRVGREGADILVFDKTVSRYHGLIVFDEERHLLSVEDAGSSNGTRVNDSTLPPRSSHPLKDGDTIAFGSAKFSVFAGEAATPAEKNESNESDDLPKEITITLPPTVMVPTARLKLQRGRGPQEVLLVPGTITIGRLPDNHISLSGDRYASGHHAQVVVEESIFRLIDVGSTNGSFLNGLRLTTNESIAMSDGDELMIGSTVFQFQVIKKKESASYAADEDQVASTPEVELVSDETTGD